MAEERPHIISMNIEHYRALLRLDMDDEKRSTIKRLLAEAEAALVRATSKSNNEV